MSTVTNIRGTSETSFQIGISGPTIYTGTALPNVTPPTPISGLLNVGDLYLHMGGSQWTYNGTSWVALGGADGSPYDIRMAFTDLLTSNQIIDTIPFPRQVVFPADMIGSIGVIGVNPTATLDIAVFDDATQIGTISISPSGVFTFATTGGVEQTIAAGSIVTFVAPSVPDATANMCSITIVGTA